MSASVSVTVVGLKLEVVIEIALCPASSAGQSSVEETFSPNISTSLSSVTYLVSNLVQYLVHM